MASVDVSLFFLFAMWVVASSATPVQAGNCGGAGVSGFDGFIWPPVCTWRGRSMVISKIAALWERGICESKSALWAKIT